MQGRIHHRACKAKCLGPMRKKVPKLINNEGNRALKDISLAQNKQKVPRAAMCNSFLCLSQLWRMNMLFRHIFQNWSWYTWNMYMKSAKIFFQSHLFITKICLEISWKMTFLKYLETKTFATFERPFVANGEWVGQRWPKAYENLNSALVYLSGEVTLKIFCTIDSRTHTSTFKWKEDPTMKFDCVHNTIPWGPPSYDVTCSFFLAN